jgi:hypothetical protein
MSGPIQRFIGGIGPAWIHGPNIGPFLEAVGRTLDDAVQACYEGIRASNPLTCNPDAFPRIASDRLIRLYPTEPEASKRYRLSIWHQLRASFGTHRGQLLNLQPFFGTVNNPIIRIVHQEADGAIATWWTINAAGVVSVSARTPSNWNWDQNFFRWSRYWVIIYVDSLVAPVGAEWDDGCEWDDGTIWDGYLSEAQLTDIRGIINEASAPHSVLAGIILARDPASFDPTGAVTAIGDGTFTHPSGDWDRVVRTATGLPVRLATASYAYEDESALP